MDSIERVFGRVLVHLRKQKGYTQQTFALHIGIDRSYYGQIERGEVSLTLGKIEKIAKGLHLEITELTQYLEPPSQTKDLAA